MTPVEYAAITTAPWIEPHNPGHIPIIAHGNEPVDAAQLARIHDEFRRIHTNRVNVDQAPNRIILEAYLTAGRIPATVCKSLSTSNFDAPQNHLRFHQSHPTCGQLQKDYRV
jgi:hypothetical protein